MINRSITNVLLLSLGLALSAAGASAQNFKVASIDLKKLFENYWKTKQFNESLQSQREDMLKERNALTDKLKKADEEYKKLLESANDQAVSAEEREKRKKAAENKLVELRQIDGATEQFLRNAANTLQETEARMRNNIVKELKEAITGKAKNAGYSLVIDSSADTPVGTPVFLYSAVDDITEIMTAELNAKAPPRTAPEEKPRPSGTDTPKKDEKK